MSREARDVAGEVISEAVFAAYPDRPLDTRTTRYELPTSGEGGLQPGVDLDSHATLEEVMADRA